MDMNRRSKIGLSSTLIIVAVAALSLAYHPTLIDQSNVDGQNQAVSVEKELVSEQKKVNAGNEKTSESSHDLDAKIDPFKIVDPDSIELEGFPKIVEINIGGEIIRREFSAMEISKFPAFSLENSSAYINALKPLVENGSGPAANKLHYMLESCLSAPRDEATYRQNEQTILQENKTTHGMSVDQHLVYNEALFLRCQGVSDDDLKPESLDQLLDFALENGSQIALSQLANSHLYNGDFDKAGPLVKKLWEAGSISSAESLSIIYNRTDYDGPDPTKPNLVKSYAYQFAENLISSAVRDTFDHFIWDGEAQASLDIAASRLTPQQLEEAEQLAKELVKNNEDCCIWEWPTQ